MWWREVGFGALVLAVAACAPPPASGGDSTETSSGEESATSTTSETEPSSTEGTESSTTSWGFDLPPELCDIMRTDDCPEGEKCTAVSIWSTWDTNRCVPILGDDTVGAPCMAVGEEPFYDGLDTCENGSICWPDDWAADDEGGHCEAFCLGPSLNNPNCPSGTYCQAFASGVLNQCKEVCDPLAPRDGQCSNPTAVCVRNTYLHIDAYSCESPWMAAEYGDECLGGDTRCEWGLACSPDGELPTPDCEDKCCTQLCDVWMPNTCPDAMMGQECIAYNFVIPGYEHVGWCGFP